MVIQDVIDASDVGHNKPVATIIGAFITLGASGLLACASFLWFKYMPGYHSWVAGRLKNIGLPSGRGVMSNSSRQFGGYFLLITALVMFALGIRDVFSRS